MCQVTIISLHVLVHSSGESAAGPADMIQPNTAAQLYDPCKLKPEDTSSLTDVTVYEIVSVNMWPPSTATATLFQDSVVWKTLLTK